MSGGPPIIYNKVKNAGFCYVYQLEVCKFQNQPSCDNGRHECFRCWQNNLRASHGCYTKLQNVCTTRSENFQHYPPRNTAGARHHEDVEQPYLTNEPGPQDDVDLYDDDFSYGRRRTTSAFPEPNHNPVYQSGDNRKRFSGGSSNYQRPMHGNEDAGAFSVAKRRRSDLTLAEDGEELRMKIVKLEYDLKLEKEKVTMKDEVRQSEKLNLEKWNLELENKNKELDKRNQELVKKNEELEKRNQEIENKSMELDKKKQDLEKGMKEKSQELENKTKEISDLLKSADQVKVGYTQERQQLLSQIMNLRQQITNLRHQIQRLSQVKGIPSAGSMNAQVYGSATRNDVPVYIYNCKKNGCQAKFTQQEVDDGTSWRHGYEVHGFRQTGLPTPSSNPGLGNGTAPRLLGTAPGPSMVGISSGSFRRPLFGSGSRFTIVP